MKVCRVLIGVILATLGASSIGRAQGAARHPGWEFGADANYQLAKDIDFEGGSHLGLTDEFGLGLSIGYRFTPRWELQFAIDWNSVDYGGTLQSADIPSLRAEVTGTTESVMPRLNGVFNLMTGPITPYLTAGLGWAWIDSNIPTGQVSAGCWWDPWWGRVCTPYRPTRSEQSFTWQAGFGLRWDVNEYATVKLAYEKTWVDLSNATATPGFDQLKLAVAYRE